MSDLKSALMDIDGIGEKKAEKILEVLEGHDLTGESKLLQKARESAREGDYRKAALFLARSEE